ncbi:hypothetical protein ACFL2Q_17110 [Thermodesulfobacteriota bacterium]
MSRKNLKNESSAVVNMLSGKESVSREKPPVWYRCICPECGEDALELHGLYVFPRAEFLGVTHDGEFGCGHLELDGDYHWVIECRACEYRAFDTDKLLAEPLLEWACANGKAIEELKLTCPVCGDNSLEKTSRMSRSVRTAYETSGNEETGTHAEVALSFAPVLEYGDSVRYCCFKSHELTKEDGSPIRTAEELV